MFQDAPICSISILEWISSTVFEKVCVSGCQRELTRPDHLWDRVIDSHCKLERKNAIENIVD